MFKCLECQPPEWASLMAMEMAIRHIILGGYGFKGGSCFNPFHTKVSSYYQSTACFNDNKGLKKRVDFLIPWCQFSMGDHLNDDACNELRWCWKTKTTILERRRVDKEDALDKVWVASSIKAGFPATTVFPWLSARTGSGTSYSFCEGFILFHAILIPFPPTKNIGTLKLANSL